MKEDVVRRERAQAAIIDNQAKRLEELDALYKVIFPDSLGLQKPCLAYTVALHRWMRCISRCVVGCERDEHVSSSWVAEQAGVLCCMAFQSCERV